MIERNLLKTLMINIGFSEIETLLLTHPETIEVMDDGVLNNDLTQELIELYDLLKDKQLTIRQLIRKT